jgi:hypothetical protein
MTAARAVASDALANGMGVFEEPVEACVEAGITLRCAIALRSERYITKVSATDNRNARCLTRTTKAKMIEGVCDLAEWSVQHGYG